MGRNLGDCGGTHRNAGGIPSYVQKGTVKDSSFRKPSKVASKGVNYGKSTPVAQPRVQSSHSPSGGRTGKTSMKMSRQQAGAKESKVLGGSNG